MSEMVVVKESFLDFYGCLSDTFTILNYQCTSQQNTTKLSDKIRKRFNRLSTETVSAQVSKTISAGKRLNISRILNIKRSVKIDGAFLQFK